ncbi:MAG: T9SS type A sorting domain-containing protein [Lentimicrobium sp.]|nr:T9SS type A sorting domain-containing protein [Lentimicrobium sp.]
MKKIILSLVLAIGSVFTMASQDISAPELVSPSNNLTGVAPKLDLDWNSVVGAPGLYYMIQLSTDEAFTAPSEFTTDLTRYQVSNLMFGGVYFWRVKAVDPTGSSDWTETRKFTIIVRPTISRPLPNATVNSNVEVQWQSINGIDTFEFQFDTTSTFDSPALAIFNAAGHLGRANAANLYFGETYYVRLRAQHTADVSEWSDVRSVTIINTFPLRQPADGAVGMTPDVELQWTEIKGVNKYNIYISTEPDFLHYEIYNALKTVTRTRPDTLNFNTQYYWRMAAIHSKDTLFSPIRSFTTLSTVNLVSPANNSTNVILQPSLTWSRISGTLSYSLELGKNSDLSSAFKYNVLSPTSGNNVQFKVPIHVLDSAGVFYWRVLANSSRDTSDWSPTWNFRTVTLGIDDPGSVQNGIKVYPVPAVNTINVKLKNSVNGVAEVNLYDLLGKVRFTDKIPVASGMIKNLELGDLPDGMYVLRLQVDDYNAMSRVIIRK